MTRQTLDPALDAVLALVRAPKLAETMRLQPLPAGISGLLRSLAHDPFALDECANRIASSREEASAAVEFYVKSVLLHPGASAWRILGHEPGASRAQLREHMRLLLIWLHPDRARSEWQVNYARRVIDAWQLLSNTGSIRPAQTTMSASRPQNAYSRPWIARPIKRHQSRIRLRVGTTLLLVGIVSGGMFYLFATKERLVAWSLQAKYFWAADNTTTDPKSEVSEGEETP